MSRINRLVLMTVVGVPIFTLPAAAVTVSEIVGQVSQDQYTHYLADPGFLYTHTGNDRRWSGQHDLARGNIQTTLQTMGLNVSLEPFVYNSATYYNVVAVKPGSNPAAGAYIVGAHYDSVGCPGADDNASGVAGVLEAARVLAPYSFASTLKFIAFDREEQGLVGSWAYTSSHAGENVRGMVAMDMIAYNPAADHDNVYVYYANTSPPPITSLLAQAVLEYGNGLTSTTERLASASSDHYPFYSHGFDAALLIERNVWSNPYYHSTADAIETNYLDYAYATNITRATVGYLADNAILVPEPGTLLLLILGGMICLLAHAKSQRRKTK